MNRRKIIRKVKRILQDCNITEAPVPVVEIARKYGFVVIEKILKEDESGFMILSKEEIPVGKQTARKIIALNKNESPTRKRFTIAHELGHYFLEYEGKENELSDDIIVHREEFSPEPQKERDADMFAGELLMPTEMLEDALDNLLNVELLFSDVASAISRKFMVSYSAAQVKLDIFLRSLDDR